MADDDVPLAALAKKPSVSKVTDDTPLSSLASTTPKNTPQKKASTKSLPKPAGSPKAPGAPGAVAGKSAGKGRPKAAAGSKRRASSSSSSSSYSYSSSSDSEDNKGKASRAGSRGKFAKKRSLAIRKRTSMDDGAEEQAETGGAVKKRERSQKEELVAKLLCRWWFSDEYRKEDWPPQDDAFYLDQLAKNKLRRVTVQEWEWLPDVDDAGLRKVYELSQFRGVFRNATGDLIDLRPKDRCPCLNNFMKKDVHVLCTMLISAYENQLQDLKNCRYIKQAQEVEKEIRVELTKVRKIQQQAKAMQ